MMSLISVAKLIMGQSPPSSSYNDEGKGLPFYQGKADFGFIYPTPRKYCTNPKKVAEVGDILMSVRAPVGPVNIANSKSCIGRGIAAIRAIKIDQSFLYFDLIFQEAAIASLGTGSTFKAINKSQLENVKIPEFPLPEQRKIAYVLGIVQKAIEKQDQLIKTTTELKKALMQKLFTEGLPEFRRKAGLYGEPQKETEIGLVPESWEVVRLGKYAYIENGYAFKSVDYVKDGIPLIRISNVSHGYLIDKDNKYLPEAHFQSYSKFALINGDLIISLTRPVTSGGLKYCFIEEKHLPALLNQRVGRFQVRDNKRLSKDFLYHLVFTQYFVGELFRLFGGSSQQPNVSPTQLESFKVPIPNFEEQKEIAKSLFALNKKVSIAKNKKQTLTALFKTLLHELMTGQCRVHEIDFEKQKEELLMAAEPKMEYNK